VPVAARGSISDRNRKQDFLALDGEDLLIRLRSVPVTSWRYRDEVDRTVRHVGPIAQDWQRTFGFSADSTTINMSDLDGVSLAAVEALDARTRGVPALEREVAALRAENAELRARLERIEARLR
jgi:trimeric autotransporter adhesin